MEDMETMQIPGQHRVAQPVPASHRPPAPAPASTRPPAPTTAQAPHSQSQENLLQNGRSRAAPGNMPPEIPPHLTHLYNLHRHPQGQDALRTQFKSLTDSLGYHRAPDGHLPYPGRGTPHGGMNGGRPPPTSNRLTVDLVMSRSNGSGINTPSASFSAAPTTNPPATGRCPICDGKHAPSTCDQIKKERHVRLALDGLSRWSSSPQELAAEKAALKKRLRDIM